MTKEQLEKIRCWWIQKSVNNNIPISAVFEVFQPSVRQQGCEWIRVVSQDDLQKVIGMGITRYTEVMTKLEKEREINLIFLDVLQYIDGCGIRKIIEGSMFTPESEAQVIKNKVRIALSKYEQSRGVRNETIRND